jgi:hypothetical protein
VPAESRTRTFALALATLALLAIVTVWCAHPICMPLSAADVTEAAKWAPLETAPTASYTGRYGSTAATNGTSASRGSRGSSSSKTILWRTGGLRRIFSRA